MGRQGPGQAHGLPGYDSRSHERYALCQALIGHELEDAILNGRLCLYSALAAPRDNPAEWLDMAASLMAEALDDAPGDTGIPE